MNAFYVDLVRDGRRFTLLAGPFPTELIARRYEVPAFNAAVTLDPMAAFDSYGVVSITDYRLPGLVNDHLAIPPADLLAA